MHDTVSDSDDDKLEIRKPNITLNDNITKIKNEKLSIYQIFLLDWVEEMVWYTH